VEGICFERPSEAVCGGIYRAIERILLKAAGGTLADELSPLDVNASPSVVASARTYSELEARFFICKAIEGMALRYGFLWTATGKLARDSSRISERRAISFV
jgi:hypothetical protein